MSTKAKFSSPDARRFHRWAVERGWTVHRASGKHIIYVRPGCQPVTVARTPSCHRAWKNCQAQMRRYERQLEMVAA